MTLPKVKGSNNYPVRLTQGYELLLKYITPDLESQTTQSLTEESEEDESSDEIAKVESPQNTETPVRGIGG